MLAVLALPFALGSLGTADDSLPDPGWAVTVTPADNLTDGQRVAVNFTSRSDVSVFNVEIRQCRLDTTYVIEDDVRPSAGKCPTGALSSSGQGFVARSASQGIITRIKAPGGMTLSFRVGVGIATWTSPSGAFALTCDPTNPCALVVQLRLLDGVAYAKIPLTFADSDPIAACGGTAPGAARSEGSDDLVDTWAAWTRDYCARA